MAGFPFQSLHVPLPLMTDHAERTTSSLDPGRGEADSACEDYLELSHNLRSLAERLVSDNATADDLVQEAWLAALEGPPERVRNLNAWLRRVVRNLAHRARRRAQRQRDVEVLWAPGEAVDPVQDCEHHSSYRLLRENAERLREPYRAVILEHFFEGLSVAEVAQRRARPLDTVKSQIRRGVQELRRTLDHRHGGDRAAWASVLLPALWGRKSSDVWASWGLGALLVTAIAVPALFVGISMSKGRDAHPVAVAEVEEPPPFAPLERDETPSFPRRPVSVAAPASEDPVPPSHVAEPRSVDFVVLHPDGSVAEESMARVWGKHRRSLGEYRSDSFGSIRFEVHPGDLLGPPAVPGPYRGLMVTARARDGAWTPQFLLSIPPEGRVFEFHSPGPGQVLEGVVRNEAGEPVAGAFVSIAPDGVSLSRTTDGDPHSAPDYKTASDGKGRFRLEGLPLRTHRLFVRAPGLQPSRCYVRGEDLRLERDVVLRRGPGLTGRLRYPDGRPAAHVRVWDATFTDRGEDRFVPEARTAADGTYRLEGVEKGPRRIYAHGPRGQGSFASVVLRFGDEELVWDATLVPHAGLRLQIVDSQGDALPRAAVALAIEREPAWGEVEHSDAEGRVHFPHAVGEVGVSIQRSNADTSYVRRGIQVTPEEQVISVPEFAGEFGVVRGTLVDDRGLPFPRAIVVACGGSRSVEVETDPLDGSFVIASLEPGPYELWGFVEQHGKVEFSRPVHVETGSRDIGPWRARSALPVTLEWPMGAAPSPESPWLIEVLGPCVDRERLIRIVQHPAEQVELSPGDYRLRPSELRSASGQLFEVSGDGPATVQVGG